MAALEEHGLGHLPSTPTAMPFAWKLLPWQCLPLLAGPLILALLVALVPKWHVLYIVLLRLVKLLLCFLCTPSRGSIIRKTRCTHEGCGKHFASPSRLKRHGKVHEGYKCQKGCSFMAKTWTELLKHMRTTHKEEVLCEVCKKTFKRKDYLKQHMKTHTPERSVCRCPREGCGRTYTTVFNLQSHILSFHEERRPFACEHAGCGKTFAMKQSLTRHAVVHDPDKRKMKLKVKQTRKKRSLASRLSGYIPPKGKQHGLSLPQPGDLLNGSEDEVLSTVTLS